MKNKFNSIEEYNDAYRKQLKDTWESEIRLYKNWLDGHRSYQKVGWLVECHKMTDEEIKRKLEYANNILNNLDYLVQSHSYKYKKPQTNKDNDLSFVGKGEGWENSSHIRVPSLKRKTAWKRFYKMFPDLIGKKVIHGSSVSEYHGLNKSTIKLKKVKK